MKIIVKNINREFIQIEGIASTEDRDFHGEIVKQKGLDLSRVQAGIVHINLEHLGRPIGKVYYATITERGLFIKGKIYSKLPEAYEIINRLKANGPNELSMSIEMENVVYSPSDKSKIISADLSGIALIGFNEEPANPHTYVNFLKSVSKEVLLAELKRRAQNPNFKKKLMVVLSRYK